MYMNAAVQYVRPKQVPFVRETLQGDVRHVVDADDLDLDVDPCAVSIPGSRYWCGR
jgi:Ras GTPase-activating-like protein IQGAP2/3